MTLTAGFDKASTFFSTGCATGWGAGGVGARAATTGATGFGFTATGAGATATGVTVSFFAGATAFAALFTFVTRESTTAFALVLLLAVEDGFFAFAATLVFDFFTLPVLADLARVLAAFDALEGADFALAEWTGGVDEFRAFFFFFEAIKLLLAKRRMNRQLVALQNATPPARHAPRSHNSLEPIDR